MKPAITEKVGKGHPPKEYQWKKGQSGNPSGRPKNTLKDYVRQKLCGMTEQEKEMFLKGIPKDFQWRMGEGNPTQEVENKGEGFSTPALTEEIKKLNVQFNKFLKEHS